MGISVTEETLERANRGTKAKSITSCDNAFLTNILLAQAAHRTPPGKRPAGTEINPHFMVEIHKILVQIIQKLVDKNYFK
ncbi:hypothetical protein LAV72_21985 [Lysinibacillus xylanilyticus]|uniref:hypothetical protein n=1 Tax=Lysinibacillus xylanilyticus TaxID=582475 RepID=UPI002B2543BA|nr:hypothetical protein [Lysinibacillus xylanilyticus]MEB2302278.1 hypothetical protein [Lysinibacillus xylanilyticus]